MSNTKINTTLELNNTKSTPETPFNDYMLWNQSIEAEMKLFIALSPVMSEYESVVNCQSDESFCEDMISKLGACQPLSPYEQAALKASTLSGNRMRVLHHVSSVVNERTREKLYPDSDKHDVSVDGYHGTDEDMFEYLEDQFGNNGFQTEELNLNLDNPKEYEDLLANK